MVFKIIVVGSSPTACKKNFLWFLFSEFFFGLAGFFHLGLDLQGGKGFFLYISKDEKKHMSGTSWEVLADNYLLNLINTHDYIMVFLILVVSVVTWMIYIIINSFF